MGGKLINAPIITVDHGKAKRTVDEQITLEYNSAVKKYLDKGYKSIQDLEIKELTTENVETALPKERTDQNGVKKVMLCKILDKTNTKLTEKD